MDFAELRRKANENDAEAQYLLAECYLEGTDVEQSFYHAVKWLEKSVAQNYAAAQYSLGYCFEKGNGVPVDMQKAIELYRKAADNGYSYAIGTLAYCYHEGVGVEQSFEKAIEIYSKGIESGYFDMAHNLARIYEEMNNFDEAFKWLAFLAEKNDPDLFYCVESQYLLGKYYQEGKSVKKNNEQAIKWYTLAAENTHSNANEEIGDYYYDKLKTITGLNYNEAVKWYSRAMDLYIEYKQYEEAGKLLLKLIECYKGGYGLKKDKQKIKQFKQQYNEMRKLSKQQWKERGY